MIFSLFKRKSKDAWIYVRGWRSFGNGPVVRQGRPFHDSVTRYKLDGTHETMCTECGDWIPDDKRGDHVKFHYEEKQRG